jgi:hypothetical protein
MNPVVHFEMPAKDAKAYGRFLYAGIRLANADVGP